MNPPWIPVEIDPPKPGRYLVAQESEDHRRYRWIRWWDGESWTNIKLDKYGPVYAWCELTPLP